MSEIVLEIKDIDWDIDRRSREEIRASIDTIGQKTAQKEQARQHDPCVMYADELDVFNKPTLQLSSVGLKRGVSTELRVGPRAFRYTARKRKPKKEFSDDLRVGLQVVEVYGFTVSDDLLELYTGILDSQIQPYFDEKIDRFSAMVNTWKKVSRDTILYNYEIDHSILIEDEEVIRVNKNRYIRTLTKDNLELARKEA